MRSGTFKGQALDAGLVTQPEKAAKMSAQLTTQQHST